uniref:Uncharacterized protein n=1 Tax=Onchocerca volvulus TaxID=6282 RepID=A0A8R1XZ66_ONCVO
MKRQLCFAACHDYCILHSSFLTYEIISILIISSILKSSSHRYEIKIKFDPYVYRGTSRRSLTIKNVRYFTWKLRLLGASPVYPAN